MVSEWLIHMSSIHLDLSWHNYMQIYCIAYKNIKMFYHIQIFVIIRSIMWKMKYFLWWPKIKFYIFYGPSLWRIGCGVDKGQFPMRTAERVPPRSRLSNSHSDPLKRRNGTWRQCNILCRGWEESAMLSGTRLGFTRLEPHVWGQGWARRHELSFIRGGFTLVFVIHSTPLHRTWQSHYVISPRLGMTCY